MKISKTNAIRILDQKKIPYEMLTYEVKDGAIDGISVANKIGHSIENVYKTLVTQGLMPDTYYETAFSGSLPW